MYGRVKLHSCHISFEKVSLSTIRVDSRAFVEEAASRRFLLLLETYLCSFRSFPIYDDLAGMFPELLKNTKGKNT